MARNYQMETEKRRGISIERVEDETLTVRVWHYLQRGHDVEQ